MRVPDPHEVRLGIVRVAEIHGDVAFAVVVQVVKADGVKRAFRVRDRHREGHAVKEDLFRLVPVERSALGADCDQHIHAFAVVGDCSVGVDDPAHAPVVAHDLAAAGGKRDGADKRRKKCEGFFSEFHAVLLIPAHSPSSK